MAPLFLLTSVLLGLSALIKVRSSARAGLGLAPLVVLELAGSVAAALIVISGLSGRRAVAWLVPVGVALVIGSSVRHVLRLGALRREREARLGARLDTYIRYLSRHEGEPPAGG